MTGPDPAGCLTCAKPTTCDGALVQLKKTCGFGDAYLAGLTCAENPTCVLSCLGLVNVCGDVGCNFCETCDCAGGGSPQFLACYNACRAT